MRCLFSKCDAFQIALSSVASLSLAELVNFSFGLGQSNERSLSNHGHNDSSTVGLRRREGAGAALRIHRSSSGPWNCSARRSC
ncbi:unnamed protein product [Ilex paraguariensis]|uniref:Secreted protein n=1 Tax=Ilex paraguariensis TaxID=185542 RepID=A0ABC8V554_9AQUA